MRIISGSHRGRKIFPPSNIPARPTTDLAKESLFNILWNYVDLEELRVLDLFSGTGNITYEFASRGCKEVVSVEMHKRSADFIKKTAEQLNFENVKVIRTDVFHFLKHHSLPFDIIFADPPYDLKESLTLPAAIMEGNWLAKGGYLIIEHSRDLDFSKYPEFMDVRNYGKVHFSFFHLE